MNPITTLSDRERAALRRDYPSTWRTELARIEHTLRQRQFVTQVAPTPTLTEQVRAMLQEKGNENLRAYVDERRGDVKPFLLPRPPYVPPDPVMVKRQAQEKKPA